MIATEAGRFSSDVLLVSKKDQLIEIEIKTSKADFNADFKKQKHQIYQQTKNQFVPHHFYFAIPANMPKLVRHVTTKLSGKPYGIILVHPEKGFTTHKIAFTNKPNPDYREAMYSYEKRVEWLDKFHQPYKIISEQMSATKNGWGQLVYERPGIIPFNDRVKIVKKAIKLHNREVSDNVKYTIVQRMGSEIATLRRNIEFDKEAK